MASTVRRVPKNAFEKWDRVNFEIRIESKVLASRWDVTAPLAWVLSPGKRFNRFITVFLADRQVPYSNSRKPFRSICGSAKTGENIGLILTGTGGCLYRPAFQQDRDLEVAKSY